jgi:hypothetical protein
MLDIVDGKVVFVNEFADGAISSRQRVAGRAVHGAPDALAALDAYNLGGTDAHVNTDDNAHDMIGNIYLSVDV